MTAQKNKLIVKIRKIVKAIFDFVFDSNIVLVVHSLNFPYSIFELVMLVLNDTAIFTPINELIILGEEKRVKDI